MKKVLSLLVALMLVCAMNIALADTTLDKDNLSGTTLVTLTIDRAADSFTVIIPSSVTIDPATKKGQCAVTLKSGWELISGNRFFVGLKDAANGIKQSGDSRNFTLISKEGNKVNYGIKLVHRDLYLTNTPNAAGYIDVHYCPIIEVGKSSSNSQDKVSKLEFDVYALPEPGTYTDTLTFEIIIE